MHSIQPHQPCPCGSSHTFQQCCDLIIQSDSATSPEILMRSRYTAYVTHQRAYLLQSWHSTTRPASLTFYPIQWQGLTIIRNNQHTVEFSAIFQEGNQHKTLHEVSHFLKENGHWRYLDGACQIHTVKRNERCPCQSQRKYKHCCGKQHHA